MDDRDLANLEASTTRKEFGLEPIENNESPLCEGCGECCRGMPGANLPSDFPGLQKADLKKRIDTFRELIDSGWQINWSFSTARFKDGHFGLFLRPRTCRGKQTLFYNPKAREICLFLNDKTGCKLKWDERPSECRILVPSRGLCSHDDPIFESGHYLREWWIYEPAILIAAFYLDQAEFYAMMDQFPELERCT